MRGRCVPVRRLQGYDVSTRMGRVRAAVTVRVDDANDLAVVRLVYPGQAAAGEELARQPSQYAHADPLDMQTSGEV
jgi:hypothetical protein